jgi:hypothetical protein
MDRVSLVTFCVRYLALQILFVFHPPHMLPEVKAIKIGASTQRIYPHFSQLMGGPPLLVVLHHRRPEMRFK